MAAFASYAAAELRAKQKGPAGDNTWYESHAARDINGNFIVRFRRFMTKAGAGNDPTLGNWIETNQDNVT